VLGLSLSRIGLTQTVRRIFTRNMFYEKSYIWYSSNCCMYELHLTLASFFTANVTVNKLLEINCMQNRN